MSTVKREKGVDIVKDDVHMDESPLKSSEVKAIVKQAVTADKILTEEDVKAVKIKNQGYEVTLEPGQKHDHPGKPIQVNSKRQQELLKRAIKEELGLLQKGRPADPSSNRQKTLRDKLAKAERGELRQGRPAYTPEQREQAEKDKKKRNEERMTEIRRLAKEEVERMQMETATK